MSSIKEKMLEFDNNLLNQLSEYGFSKKRKHEFRRKQGDCFQHISILETKVRGESKVYISICVGFTYEQIDKIIYFLKNKNYDNKWGTANINISSLMNNNKPYGFYIGEDTELQPIIDDIMSVIKIQGLEFLSNCDTLEKFEKMLVCRDKDVLMSTYILNKPEWNTLALAILLGSRTTDDVIREYEESFLKNETLLQVVKERINKYDIVKECI